MGTGRPTARPGAVREPEVGWRQGGALWPRQAPRERGVEVIVLNADADLEALASDAVASGADAVGVAGGDGSLAVIADVALTYGVPFVAFPPVYGITSRSTWAWTGETWSAQLGAFTDGVERQINVTA